ncbi:MAG: hypothetical protein ACRDJ3_03330 [Solirubrobacteraceae bacterium]
MRRIKVSLRVLKMCIGVSAASVALTGAGVNCGVARAAPATPAWQVTAVASPTVFVPAVNRIASYYAIVENVGGALSEGSFTVRMSIPPRFTVTKSSIEPEAETACVTEAGELVCTSSQTVVPGGIVVLHAMLEATGTGSVSSVVSVSGGGAAAASSDQARTSIGAEHAPAGVALLRSSVTGPAGEAAVQAAGHPSLFTNTMLFDNVFAEASGEPQQPVEPIKDLVFYLPLGMLGNPTVSDLCPEAVVETINELSGCPPASRIGSILAMILNNVFANGSDVSHVGPLFNVQPENGYAAEFAFSTDHIKIVQYVNVVRRDHTYMLRVATPGVPQIALLIGLIESVKGDIQDAGEYDRGAFLSNPSGCSSQPLDDTLEINSWEHPEPMIAQSTQAYPAIEGCGLLQFSTVFSSQPSSSQADEPSGYTVDVGVPQAPNNFTGLGTPPYRTVRVALPEGTSLSPAGANGLSACQAMGPDGINIEDAESEALGPDGLPRPVAGHCPASSQVATVRARSPELSEELTGHMFAAQPGCGWSGKSDCSEQDAKDGNLFGLYLELEAPHRGVIIKLEGKALVDPSTGRVTTVFDDTPEFPVSDLVVETTNGPRAPLANPQTCGTATSASDVTPWSAPGTPDSLNSSSFTVDWDGHGGSCPAGLPFAPTLVAGTVVPLAGAYSPFTLTLKREDREQDIASLSTTLPPGVLAAVSHVARCPELQASQGGCPVSSRVGSTTVAIGSGPQPFYQTGQVFLTGPYQGAPFGLSVVVPAVAGPFDLGNVIVRAALYIDPATTQVTAVSGELPRMIDGVPLRIRMVNVTLDAPDFTLNPTDCVPMRITGTVASTQGAKASVSSPFQARGCRSLPFKPRLTASTRAHTSRTGGASLTVKVTSAAGQANIGKVDLTLPKQLPSRNSTLQQACTQAQFTTNPAACPQGSNIGVARAISPLLSVPLTGPAYLVSHGGAGFPDVVFVLQGEGVRIELTGHTLIKKGVTYSRFETVPDAPISTFETILPQGPHSILGTNIPTTAKNSLCSLPLNMPTTIHGQNGAILKQTTKITITGCPKTKKKQRARHGHPHSTTKHK